MLRQLVKYVHVDAFTRSPFRGAQAAVAVVPTRLSPEQMQNAAQELCLPTTAFVYKPGDGRFELRAFSPFAEVDAFGTAALAAAHTLQTEGHVGHGDKVELVAPSGETLVAGRRADHVTLTLAARPVEPFTGAPAALASAPGVRGVLFNGVDLVLEMAREEDVRAFVPDLALLAAAPGERLVVTAVSSTGLRDYVVRVFAPKVGLPEAPACGAACRALGPLWLERLGIPLVRGEQLFRRPGVLHVERADAQGHLVVSGQAITVAKGLFTVVP